MTPDRDVQSLIIQAGEIRTESQDLRAAILEFQSTLKRGLFRASIQGVIMVFIGIIVAISFLGLAAQTWSCDATTLAKQKGGSLHFKACEALFPQTGPQVDGIKRAQAAQKATQKATQENQEAILAERRRNNDLLDKLAGFDVRIACVLKIPPDKRTDSNVNDCLAGRAK